MIYVGLIWTMKQTLQPSIIPCVFKQFGDFKTIFQHCTIILISIPFVNQNLRSWCRQFFDLRGTLCFSKRFQNLPSFGKCDQI